MSVSINRYSGRGFAVPSTCSSLKRRACGMTDPFQATDKLVVAANARSQAPTHADDFVAHRGEALVEIATEIGDHSRILDHLPLAPANRDRSIGACQSPAAASRPS